jgi:hypothetical protein
MSPYSPAKGTTMEYLVTGTNEFTRIMNRAFPAKGKQFIIDCVSANGDDITEMVDNAITITRRTFLKHVDRDNLKAVEVDLGYVLHPSQGLTMAADWAVSYHRGKYRGQPCVFFKWSCIEYVFV